MSHEELMIFTLESKHDCLEDYKKFAKLGSRLGVHFKMKNNN